MTRARLAKLRAVLDARQPDLTVVLENVHKPHNTSAIMRTCDAVGIHEVHAVIPAGRFAPNLANTQGSEKWVGVTVHERVEAAVGALRARGFAIYAAHLSERAVDYRDADYTVPCAVLLGQELGGVTPTALALCQREVVIPMHGLVASLNVSVAAAIILFEAERQRRARGLYTTPRLAPADYERTLFEWLHPEVAAVYRGRGESYPKVDEDGDIVSR